MNILELSKKFGNIGNINMFVTCTEVYPLTMRLWECHDCKRSGRSPFKGKWGHPAEFSDKCPNCGAKQSSKPGVGLWIQQKQSVKIVDETGYLYMDLWNKDIGKMVAGKKYELLNCYKPASFNLGLGQFGDVREC